MHPIFFKIGSLEIRFYGLMYAIAFFMGLYLCKKDARRKGFSEQIMEDYLFIAMISGLLGGRLYYVIFNWSYYSKNLSEIPAVWHGGLAIHGGIIGAVIASIIYAKIKKVSYWDIMDIGASPLLLGQAIGRIGNFTNGEVHGVPVFTPLKVIFTNSFTKWWEPYKIILKSNEFGYVKINEIFRGEELVPWGLVFPKGSSAGDEFPGISVHPAMLYELILNLIGFFILWFILRKKNMAKGSIAFIYLIFYSLIRSFVSFFRAEDLMFYNMRAPHLISILIILISIVGLIIVNNKKPQES